VNIMHPSLDGLANLNNYGWCVWNVCRPGGRVMFQSLIPLLRDYSASVMKYCSEKICIMHTY